VAQEPGGRLEVGGGLGGELIQMTETMGTLQALATAGTPRGIPVVVQSRLSANVAAELPGYIVAADPDTVVLRRGAVSLAEVAPGGKTQLVVYNKPLPQRPTAAVAHWVKGADADAAVQVAAQLAVADQLDLVLTPVGRPTTTRAADLTKRGLAASAGTQPPDSIVVGPIDLLLAPVGAGAVAAAASNGEVADGAVADGAVAANGQAGQYDGSEIHLAVVAGSNEASDDMDQWVEALDGHRSGKAGSSE
jgi:hypothetical protein